MTEAFSEPPAEATAPVGEGGGAELADRVRGEAALQTCHELKPLHNPPSKPRGLETALLGPSGCLSGYNVWHVIGGQKWSVSQFVTYRRCVGSG